jgi:hypothetical protein
MKLVMLINVQANPRIRNNVAKHSHAVAIQNADTLSKKINTKKKQLY